MSVAIYARVSTDDQADRNTVDIQLEALRRMVENGLEYIDEGVSGKILLGDRPAGRRLLADARAKKFSMVVV
jgi:site-specific DNA recombinase